MHSWLQLPRLVAVITGRLLDRVRWVDAGHGEHPGHGGRVGAHLHQVVRVGDVVELAALVELGLTRQERIQLAEVWAPTPVGAVRTVLDAGYVRTDAVRGRVPTLRVDP